MVPSGSESPPQGLEKPPARVQLQLHCTLATGLSATLGTKVR